MAQASVNITYLGLSRYASYVNDEFLNVIGTHARSLRELCICGGEDQITPSDLWRFLETTAHSYRTLRKIGMITVKAFDGHVLHDCLDNQLHHR